MASTTGASSATHVAGLDNTRKRPSYWHATMYLHIASLLVSAIYIIITGVVSQRKYGITLVAFYTWIALPAPGLSLVVISGPELITRFFRAGHRGWIPAVHLGLNLIAWLFACGMGSWFAYGYSHIRRYDFGDWESGCPDPGAYLFQCWGVPLYPYFVAIIVLLFVLMAIHFSIFVLSILQHRERQMMKRQAAKV